MRREWILIGLALVLLGAAITGGAVLASGVDEAGNGGDEAEEVVVEDGDVTADSIENTEAAAGQPDKLAVRIAGILGTDPQATYDAMLQVDGAVEANPGRSGVGNQEDEQDVDSRSEDAEGMSYGEYGEKIGAILDVDGLLVANAIAQAYEELYGVERDIWDNGSGRDKESKEESDKHLADPVAS